MNYEEKKKSGNRQAGRQTKTEEQKKRTKLEKEKKKKRKIEIVGDFIADLSGHPASTDSLTHVTNEKAVGGGCSEALQSLLDATSLKSLHPLHFLPLLLSPSWNRFLRRNARA